MRNFLLWQLRVIANGVAWALVATLAAFLACPLLMTYPVLRLVSVLILVWALWGYWRDFATGQQEGT